MVPAEYFLFQNPVSQLRVFVRPFPELFMCAVYTLIAQFSWSSDLDIMQFEVTSPQYFNSLSSALQTWQQLIC
jgi:hypothetical protein